MIEAWRRGRLLFGKMWEDPAVEISLLRPGANRVLCVASAGCTALALAGLPEMKVDAVDLNPSQIHFCRLKLRLLESSTQAAMLELLGRDARAAAQAQLAELPTDSRRYWERHLGLLSRGLNQAGRVDRMLWLLRLGFERLFVSSERIQEMLEQSELPRQEQLFETHWQGWRWKAAFALGLHPWLLSLVYGRPMVERLPADYRQQMQQRMRRFLSAFPARDNPYLWQAFAGCYPSSAGAARLPLYLSRHGQPNFRCADLTEFLQQSRHSYDLFCFSNVLEVADTQAIEDLVRAAVARANPGAVLCFRFMMGRPPILQNPEEFRLEHDSEAAEGCAELDRALFCNHFQVYRAADQAEQLRPRSGVGARKTRF